MVATSSYTGGIQDAFHGYDTARFLKSLLAELLRGNENVDICTRIRNDNSIVVDRVRSINSVKGAQIEWFSRE